MKNKDLIEMSKDKDWRYTSSQWRQLARYNVSAKTYQHPNDVYLRAVQMLATATNKKKNKTKHKKAAYRKLGEISRHSNDENKRLAVRELTASLSIETNRYCRQVILKELLKLIDMLETPIFEDDVVCDENLYDVIDAHVIKCLSNGWSDDIAYLRDKDWYIPSTQDRSLFEQYNRFLSHVA